VGAPPPRSESIVKQKGGHVNASVRFTENAGTSPSPGPR
jgi:hypothetical protein